MNFEDWFEKEYGNILNNNEANGAILLAFKEVARYAWNAAPHHRQIPYGLQEIKDEHQSTNL